MEYARENHASVRGRQSATTPIAVRVHEKVAEEMAVVAGSRSSNNEIQGGADGPLPLIFLRTHGPLPVPIQPHRHEGDGLVGFSFNIHPFIFLKSNASGIRQLRRPCKNHTLFGPLCRRPVTSERVWVRKRTDSAAKKGQTTYKSLYCVVAHVVSPLKLPYRLSILVASGYLPSQEGRRGSD